MNGNTRQNITLALMAAAVLTKYTEAHWGLKVTADDVLEMGAGASLGWHFLATSFGPYAKRIFDHFFPPVGEQK